MNHIRVSEHSEQAAIFDFARIHEFMHPELALLFSTLNGIPLVGMSGMQRAKIINHMRAEGLKVGLPDLWLPVARNGYHGLVIELKVGINKPTPEQERWINALLEQGYQALILWGAEEAIGALCDYLGIDK